MRVLGIDPGTRRCGYGVIDVAAEGLAYVECGVIEPAGDAPLSQRLAELSSTLREILREFAPQAMAVENIFHGINARAALTLGHARGVVLAAAGEANIPVWPYSPAVVKKAVTGRGGAAKSQVGFMVRARFALRRMPAPDAVDALAVAICHAQHLPRRRGVS